VILKLLHITIAAVLVLSTLAPPSYAALQKGQQAPAIKVVTTSGQSVTLDNYTGYVLVLDFFATWCSPCKESIPFLLGINNKYGKQGLQILGMSVDEDGEKIVRTFTIDRKLTYPVALANENIQSDYSLRSVPTLFLINKKGVVVEKYQGFNAEIGKSLDAAIKRLLME
jgi:thiol-disulfide isomerase/thioredoxin